MSRERLRGTHIQFRVLVFVLAGHHTHGCRPWVRMKESVPLRARINPVQVNTELSKLCPQPFDMRSVVRHIDGVPPFRLFHEPNEIVLDHRMECRQHVPILLLQIERAFRAHLVSSLLHGT
jgi:hypothetical protein